MGKDRSRGAVVVGKKAFSRLYGTRLNMRLDTTLLNSAKTLAKKRGTTVSQVCTEALEAFVASEKSEQF